MAAGLLTAQENFSNRIKTKIKLLWGGGAAFLKQGASPNKSFNVKTPNIQGSYAYIALRLDDLVQRIFNNAFCPGFAQARNKVAHHVNLHHRFHGKPFFIAQGRNRG